MLENKSDYSPIFQFIISVAVPCYFYGYTYVSTLIPCIATLIPHIFRISTQIPGIPTLIFRTRIPIPFLAFPSLLFAFFSFRSPIPHFGFYR